jgi:outer membrane protein assembly factor BamA
MPVGHRSCGLLLQAAGLVLAALWCLAPFAVHAAAPPAGAQAFLKDSPVPAPVVCRRIVQFYQEKGHPFATCVVASANPTNTEVIIRINAGPITHVKEVGFSGNTFVSAAVLRKKVEAFARAKQRYTPAIDDAITHLAAYYRAFGFHDVKVNRELRYSGDGREVTVLFHIQEGARYRIKEKQPQRVGQIFIIGNERTPQQVILEQVPLHPGQVLSYADLHKAEENLSRLGIFETSPDGSVRPTITVIDNPGDPDSPYKDILINVLETASGGLLFGLGVSERAPGTQK